MFAVRVGMVAAPKGCCVTLPGGAPVDADELGRPRDGSLPGALALSPRTSCGFVFGVSTYSIMLLL